MNLFFGIHEVRAKHTGGVNTGYFDSLEAALRAIENDPVPYIAVWATLNPLKDLPAGAELNPSRLSPTSGAASDGDIARRCWLLLDADPQRPKGTNSTETEKDAARQQAEAVREYLRGRGWPDPVLADSGNGWHLLYRLDLANDEAARDTIRDILRRLAQLFNTSASEIDESTFNAGRVCKLYRTWTRKGPHSEERPHRRSAVIECPAEIQPVPQEMLRSLASEHKPPKPPLIVQAGVRNDVKLERLLGFLDHYSVPVRSNPRPVKGGWAVSIECPWADEHSSESNRETEVSYIPGIGNGFKCFHSHCADRHWREFRTEMEAQNPKLPPYFGKSKLPRMVHSEVARAFVESTEDFLCCYDQEAATAVWVKSRWTIGDQGDYLLRGALREFLNELYPLYPEPHDENKDPRKTLLQSPFLMHVLAEVKPLLPKKSILDFDADPWLLALPDGLVADLSIGKVRTMHRADCITRRTKMMPAPIPTPRFDQFITEIACGDAELAAFILRLCALCLSGHPEQILVICWGFGRNGKGVLLRLLAKILGPFAVTIRPNELTYSREDSDRAKRTFAKFVGKRLAVVNEASGSRLNFAALKTLSGGDRLSYAKMRQDDQEVDPTHKLVLVSNEKPNLPADPAMRGRLLFVPFRGDFSGDKGDRFIEDKLHAELPGILHKLIAVCADVKQSGLRPPASVREATDELLTENDLAGQFIADRVTAVDGSFIPLADMEREIRQWLSGIIMDGDWRMKSITQGLKAKFKYDRKRVAGRGKNAVWGFVDARLEAAGS